MSQGNSEDVNILSGDEAGQDEKLVPVSESIRYRKRAQSAEKKAIMLEDELAKVRSESERLSEDLGKLRIDHKLIRKLVSAGVSDLESAVLLAKKRLETNDEADLDSVVDELKQEKRHLFAQVDLPAALEKTAGVKGKTAGRYSTLERAASRAAATGSRADLQEYLKVRRNYV